MDPNSQEYYNAYYQWWYMQQAQQAQQMQNASVGGYNAAYYSYINNQQFYPQGAAQVGSAGPSKQSKPKKGKQPPQQQQQKQIHKCTQPDCFVTGTKKQVEVHMMDRHLIYPPGYLENEERKRSSKPSKPVIPVEGTTIMLDTPEAIEKWIGERKKQFPSAANLAEKERVQEEKRARGELPLDPQFGGKKRRSSNWHQDNNTRDRTYQTPKKPRLSSDADVSDEEEDVNGDEAPECVSSKISTQQPPSKLLLQPRLDKKKVEPKPKHNNNQFQQPNLMAKLFNDEIRQSVSYLSQTIRFLVANDFLDNVEQEVGQAEAPKLVEEVE